MDGRGFRGRLICYAVVLREKESEGEEEEEEERGREGETERQRERGIDYVGV